jgi:hypothetical protein
MAHGPRTVAAPVLISAVRAKPTTARSTTLAVADHWLGKKAMVEAEREEHAEHDHDPHRRHRYPDAARSKPARHAPQERPRVPTRRCGSGLARSRCDVDCRPLGGMGPPTNPPLSIPVTARSPAAGPGRTLVSAVVSPAEEKDARTGRTRGPIWSTRPLPSGLFEALHLTRRAARRPECLNAGQTLPNGNVEARTRASPNRRISLTASLNGRSTRCFPSTGPRA